MVDWRKRTLSRWFGGDGGRPIDNGKVAPVEVFMVGLIEKIVEEGWWLISGKCW